MSARVVTVDGPAGAGKSSASRALATRLGFAHVDTGAMYRAVGVIAHERGIPLDDDPALGTLLAGWRLELDPRDGRILVDGRDLSTVIRRPDAGELASRVSTRPVVRERLVAMQRRLGAGGGVVMEGRDIGSVVFPNADVKVYLDASPEERARRRKDDAAHAAGRHASAVETIAEKLQARDHSDRTRPVSPLTQAADALYIDTTAMPIDDVVAKVMALVERF
jgi:cytidylate kinase